MYASCMVCRFCLFFFNDTATTEIYTLSLHDALPIFTLEPIITAGHDRTFVAADGWTTKTGDSSPSAHYEHTIVVTRDRKSTRLNSSHANISYAVFCLKKKLHPAFPPPPLDVLYVSRA